jgi:hypothetical protein
MTALPDLLDSTQFHGGKAVIPVVGAVLSREVLDALRSDTVGGAAIACADVETGLWLPGKAGTPLC